MSVHQNLQALINRKVVGIALSRKHDARLVTAALGNLRTYKSHGVYVVPMTLREKVELLCTRYGVIVTPEAAGTLESKDVGTLGT